MASETAHLLANYLHHLSAAARGDNLPDRDLLERFASQRDDDAFAVLVRRHGPMVLRVCQRVLHDVHAAEDAFQATFLVLSRKAASLRCADTVSCWLHGVALRVAQNARMRSARRQKHESRAAVEKAAADPLGELSVREAQAILDEELARLPEKYRAPLVLCCLEGRTRDEAAQQLGWSAKLVKIRLEEGRERLRSRLTRRGLTLPAAFGATLLTEEAASAAVPAVLIRATVQAARAGDGVSASVALLAQSALGGTALGKVKVIIVGLLMLTGVLAAGMSVLAPPQPAEKQAEPLAVAKTPEPPKSEKPQTPHTDRYGDPLPPQALERLGTLRFRPGVHVWHLSFSADGKLLAAAMHNWNANSISLWDRATGKCLRRIDIGKKPPLALAFTPDGKILAAQDDTGEIQLWEVKTGKDLRRFRGGVGFLGNYGGRIVLSVGFVLTPDGKALATRGPDKAIHLWELATGKDLRKFQADPEDLSPLAFSRDGKMLATYNEKLIRSTAWQPVAAVGRGGRTAVVEAVRQSEECGAAAAGQCALRDVARELVRPPPDGKVTDRAGQFVGVGVRDLLRVTQRLPQRFREGRSQATASGMRGMRNCEAGSAEPASGCHGGSSTLPTCSRDVDAVLLLVQWRRFDSGTGGMRHAEC